MKTIEEKAQRYNRALTKSREFLAICEKCGTKDTVEFLEDIFPELKMDKESEDERIRKEILDYIDKATGCKRWVAWLEQQGKPVEINPTEFDLQLNRLLVQFETLTKEELASSLSFYLNVVKNGYLSDNVEPTDYNSIDPHFGEPVDKVEPKFHKGDWVIDKQGIVHQVANVVENVTNHTYGYDIVGGGYFNGNTEGVRLWNISDAKEGDVLVDSLGNVCIYQEPSTKLMYHSHCYGNHKFFIPMGGSHEIVGSYPATKEQRDQLEKAMADAGYAFDFEKKELKEIENEEYDGEDYGIDGLWHAKNILEKTLGKVDGYQTDDGILDHKCAISFIDKLYKQKPAEWSEEDESNFQGIIDELKANKHYAPDSDLPTYDRFLSWFKSLKERYVWKPSDEQIDALEHFVRSIGESGFASPYDDNTRLLYSLLEQLKKL